MVTKVSVSAQVPSSSSHGNKFLGFNGVMLSVVGDVSIDSEMFVVTSSISRICQLDLQIYL